MSSLFSRQSVYLFIAIFFSFSFALLLPFSYFSPGNIGVDDANIFFVFAKNFIAGNGLVWNQGEAPVEGFSSIIWQVICTSFFFFSDNPENILLLFSLLLISLSSTFFLLSLFKACEIDRSNKATLIKTLSTLSFMLWCLSSPGFLSWNVVSLMDTGLWTSALMSLVACYLFRKTKLFVFSLVLLCFVRPEGLGLSFVALIIYAFCELKQDRSKETYACLIKYFIFLIISMLSLTLFRLAYFSYPLPNTYYAKVGSNKLDQISSGINYFSNFLSSTKLAGPAVVLAIILIASATFYLLKQNGDKFEKLNKILFCSSIFLLGFLIYIYVGGDHFPLHRQYQGFWPLGFAVIFCAVSFFTKNPTPHFCVFGIILVFTYASIQSPQVYNMRFEYMLSRLGRAAGKRLNEMFPAQEKPRVSAIAVGGIAYTYEGQLIDLMGITNAEMAHATSERKGEKNHAAFDIETFYKISPDMIVHFGPSCILRKGFENDDFINQVLKNLPQEDRFRSQYKLMRVPSPLRSELSGGICGFISRNYADRMGKVAGINVYEWKRS